MLLAICGALIVLLGALATIQYQWSVRVAAADVQREKEHLDSSASLFASQFNELASQTSQFLRQDAWAALHGGEKLASMPKLIGELYYVEIPEHGPGRFESLTATGIFMPTPQPDWLTNSHCSGPVIEWPPAIVANIFDAAPAERALKAGTRDSRRLPTRQDRCFVARIDQAYLTATLFPQLLRQSFGETAVREYDFAVIIPNRSQDPLYGARVRPDGRKRFFSALSTLPPDRSLVVRDTAHAFMQGRSALTRDWSQGIWELQVAHKGLPLATALKQQSRRALLDVGLPGALWLAAQRTGVFELLQSLWPEPRSGPSPAHYLLLAAIHRICQPGPKTEVAGWYDRTILRSLWALPSERFSSQEFWDCFDRIGEEELEQAQIRLLGVWKQKQLVSRRLLAYDTTNFYTYVASTNTRNELAQRGHNKQGRHNLRQVGLSYVMDGDNGLSLCHHVYPGNRADAEELPEALSRIGALLDRNQIARDSVTLVLDKGSAALTNTLELEKAGVGWISALPWNQAYRAWLDDTGAPMSVQQQLMRHASIQTTMNVYGQAMPETKRQANSKIVRMVLREPKKPTGTA